MGGRCTTITQVMPNKLQRTTARTLSLMIDNLPSVEGALQCVFSAMTKDLTTEAKRTAQGVSCTTPRNDMLPDIPQNEHHFVATLSVRKSEGPEFVTTNFTFFDCNTYSSCTECVSSPFPCDWCVDGHRCTHDSAENCRNDILVTGINRIGPSIRSGPAFCPRVNATPGGSPEILVSSGLQKSIRVKVDHIAQFIIQTRFVCQFNIEGRVTSVNAQLQAACFQQPSSSAWTALNLMKGQIQFQNFVAMWLSRRRDSSTFLASLGLAQFELLFRQSCAVWLKLENCLKSFDQGSQNWLQDFVRNQFVLELYCITVRDES